MKPPWDTPERLRQLLVELVGWDSVTGTDGEARFASRLADALGGLEYFRAHPAQVMLGAVDDERSYVTALYRCEQAADTIVLISHFDTVDTAEYGPLEQLAFDPPRLTTALRELGDELDAQAASDAASGEYLFGRGVMDMKLGIALHMALLERAAAERWPINLLLLSVPDEEVNSAGMRAAVEDIERIRSEHGLEWRLLLNGEPSFPASPGDTNHYVYTGSIGKLMPSALCYGRETHAGTPLSGLTSSFITSFLTQAMEWNDSFRETVHGEATPLPVTLDQRDLRDGYSTQTPYRTSVLYNVFVMEQSAAEVMDRFEQVAREAAGRCSAEYRAICERERVAAIGDVRVLRYEQLVEHATAKLGADEVDRLVEDARTGGDPDLRAQSMRVVDALLVACQELTPAIALLFAPPCYPPVNSSDDALVQACVARVQDQARRRFDRELVQMHWFHGISDLSYVSARAAGEGWQAFERNCPGYGTSYRIPFAAMQALDAPVLNVGAYGTDPHKRTERLHVRNAFHEMPELLADLVQFVASQR